MLSAAQHEDENRREGTGLKTRRYKRQALEHQRREMRHSRSLPARQRVSYTAESYAQDAKDVCASGALVEQIGLFA